MAKKHSKNLQKIQDMVDGNFEGNVQVGYGDQEVSYRKIGDRWTDSDGNVWEQKNGYAVKNPDKTGRGFGDNCTDCEKLITKHGNGGADRDTYNRFQRCYHCQINFEIDLKSKGKWNDWVVEQEKMRWETVMKEITELTKKNLENNPFDRSVVNAMANENVSMAIKKNTN
jgi:hypothetical protein